MNNNLSFQYCQKIMIFNADKSAVLLAKRKGEADFDGTYSFVGGKLETTDGGLLAGLQREKNEEIGESARIKICPLISYNTYFVKKDGSSMVLPHYYAEYVSGEIVVNEEYSDYKWVSLNKLTEFEPKIYTIDKCVEWALKLSQIISEDDFVVI